MIEETPHIHGLQVGLQLCPARHRNLFPAPWAAGLLPAGAKQAQAERMCHLPSLRYTGCQAQSCSQLLKPLGGLMQVATSCLMGGLTQPWRSA